MPVPSRTANLARSARASWPDSQTTATSTGMPTRKTGSSPIPTLIPVTTTVNETRPITSPASRWMTASQVRGDTSAPMADGRPPGEAGPVAGASAPIPGGAPEPAPAAAICLPPRRCDVAPADPTHRALARPYR